MTPFTLWYWASTHQKQPAAKQATSIFQIQCFNFIMNTQQKIDYIQQLMQKSQAKIAEYQIIKKLGSGSFGQVLLAKRKEEEYAIKKISKKQVIKVHKLHQPFIEKEILFRLKQLCGDYEYFVKIYETESDEDFMYLILEYCPGGTLEQYIHNENLSSSVIKHIAAKLLLILEKMHKYGIVHRDLKPSNLLFTQLGFLKLFDFGTAYAVDQFFIPEVAAKIKQIRQISHKQKLQKQMQSQSSEQEDLRSSSSGQRRSTFVGTACYMAPELLNSDICGKEADLWAYGCIIYEMIFKKSPFYDTSQGMVWKKILNDKIQITSSSKNDENTVNAIELIRQLLVKQTEDRLGSGENGYQQIKNNKYFSGINWQLEARKGIPQIIEIMKDKNKESQKENVEKVLMSGVVKKKMFFGNFSQRTVVLYSTPKLLYYENESGEKKGEIKLDKNTPLEIDGKNFSVTTDKKTYYFKSKNSQEWIEMIKNAIIGAFY